MGRYTTDTGKHLNFGFWLVFGVNGEMRLTRQRPAVTRTERAMAMEAMLPKALFHTPELRGQIVIADPAGQPPLIDVAAATEALRTALGVDIDLTVVEAK